MSRRRSLNRGFQPDAQLRSSRPQARDEFVESLAQHVVGHAPTATWARSRLAFAGAVSTFILGTLVSFGGLSYAASGAAGTYHTARQVAVKHTLFVSVHKSSASSQYAPKQSRTSSIGRRPLAWPARRPRFRSPAGHFPSRASRC